MTVVSAPTHGQGRRPRRCRRRLSTTRRTWRPRSAGRSRPARSPRRGVSSTSAGAIRRTSPRLLQQLAASWRRRREHEIRLRVPCAALLPRQLLSRRGGRGPADVVQADAMSRHGPWVSGAGGACAPATDLTNISGRRCAGVARRAGGRHAGRSGGGGGRRAAEPRGGGRSVRGAVAWGADGLADLRRCRRTGPGRTAGRGAVRRGRLLPRRPRRPACRRRSPAGCHRRGATGVRTGPDPGGRHRDLRHRGRPPTRRRRCSARSRSAVAGPCLDGQLRDRRARDRDRRRPGGRRSRCPARRAPGKTRFDVAIPLASLPRRRRRRSRSARRPRGQRRGVVAAGLRDAARAAAARDHRGPRQSRRSRAGAGIRRAAATSATTPCRSPGCASRTPRAATSFPRRRSGRVPMRWSSRRATIRSRGRTRPPRAGTLLVRDRYAPGLRRPVERRRAGTAACRGEAVVSSYGGWVDVSAGSWSGKAVHRLVADRVRRR